MATVYLADDIKHRRKVALKVLSAEAAAAIGAARFLAEIGTTASLREHSSPRRPASHRRFRYRARAEREWRRSADDNGNERGHAALHEPRAGDGRTERRCRDGHLRSRVRALSDARGRAAVYRKHTAGDSRQDHHGGSGIRERAAKIGAAERGRGDPKGAREASGGSLRDCERFRESARASELSRRSGENAAEGRRAMETDLARARSVHHSARALQRLVTHVSPVPRHSCGSSLRHHSGGQPAPLG